MIIAMDEPSLEARYMRSRTVLRVYTYGLAVLAVFYLVWRVIREASPWFEAIENPLVAGAISLACLVLLPLLFGCLIEFVISPRLGKWQTWSELLNLEDRLVSLVERKSELPIVLINWPDQSVRTPGVLTSQFPGRESHPGFGAVFVPNGPQTKSGYIRIVPLDEIELTDWTFKDLQLFLLSFGSLGPEKLGLRPWSDDARPPEDAPRA